MKKGTIVLLALMAGLLLPTVIGHIGDKWSENNRALAEALQDADSAKAAADRVIAVNRTLVLELESRRARIDTVRVVVRQPFLEEAQVAPDTCRPVIEAAKKTIARLDSLHEESRVITDLYKFRLGATQDTLSYVIQTLEQLQTAALPKSRSFWSKIKPDLWVGAQGGAGLVGKNEFGPYAGIGVGLGWRF